MDSKNADVLVIGAGMSGMTAAASLSLAGLKVRVLEARDRLGGRIHTHAASQQTGVLDLGASFIHGVDGNPLIDIAKRLNLRLLGGDLDDMDGVVYAKGQHLAADRAAKLSTNIHTALFEAARQYSQVEADPSPTETLQDWTCSNEASPLYDGLENDLERECARRMTLAYNGWPGADLDKVSLRHWGFEREYQGQDVNVQDGYLNMVTAFERLLTSHGGQVALQQEVTQIEHLTKQERVRVKTKDGSEFQAPLCICTLPLGVLKKRAPSFNPALPLRRTKAIQNLGFGLLNKIVITYPEVWWADKGASFISIVPEDHLTGPMPYTKTAASLVQSYIKLTDGRPTLMFYLGGSSGEDVEKLTQDEAKAWAHQLLKSTLDRKNQGAEVPEPSEVIVTRWASDPFACGSYAYFPPNANTSPLDMVELSRPLYDGRLGFAGEACQLDYYAAVHGALISGYDEAVRAATLLGKRVPSRDEVIQALSPSH